MTKKWIARRIFKQYNWLNCIGVADGTHLPLMLQPEVIDSPNYYGQKHPYLWTMLVMNDGQKKGVTDALSTKTWRKSQQNLHLLRIFFSKVSVPFNSSFSFNAAPVVLVA